MIPIWFELMFLMLITYAGGLMIGWLLWGRAAAETMPEDGETLS